MTNYKNSANFYINTLEVICGIGLCQQRPDSLMYFSKRE